jgi:hypothetical protein
MIRWVRRARLRLRVIYTAARLRPLMIGVSVIDGSIHATSDHEIVLGEMASIRNSTIRSRIYVSGNYVTVVNNVIDLPKDQP